MVDRFDGRPFQLGQAEQGWVGAEVGGVAVAGGVAIDRGL